MLCFLVLQVSSKNGNAEKQQRNLFNKHTLYWCLGKEVTVWHWAVVISTDQKEEAGNLDYNEVGTGNHFRYFRPLTSRLGHSDIITGD